MTTTTNIVALDAILSPFSPTEDTIDITEQRFSPQHLYMLGAMAHLRKKVHTKQQLFCLVQALKLLGTNSNHHV